MREGVYLFGAPPLLFYSFLAFLGSYTDNFSPFVYKDRYFLILVKIIKIFALYGLIIWIRNKIVYIFVALKYGFSLKLD